MSSPVTGEVDELEAYHRAQMRDPERIADYGAQALRIATVSPTVRVDTTWPSLS